MQKEKNIPVYNPATEEILAYVPILSKEDVNDTINAANQAFKNGKSPPFPNELV